MEEVREEMMSGRGKRTDNKKWKKGAKRRWEEAKWRITEEYNKKKEIWVIREKGDYEKVIKTTSKIRIYYILK